MRQLIEDLKTREKQRLEAYSVGGGIGGQYRRTLVPLAFGSCRKCSSLSKNVQRITALHPGFPLSR